MIISYYTLFKFISKFHLLRYFLREEKSCLHFKRNVASRNEAFSPWQCQFVRFIVTALHGRGQLPVTNRSFFDLKPFLFPSFLFFPFPFPFFFTTDQICLAVTRHAHSYKSFPPGSTCHDRNSLHDDDLSLACANQDSAITVQPHVSSPLHPRFAFSRGDLGGRPKTTESRDERVMALSVFRRDVEQQPIAFLRLFRRHLWTPPWWVGNRGESWLCRR